MPTVFVSHSSKDDRAARGLEAWLTGHGFTDIFFDHANIAGGENWAQALRAASGACRVVICLVTERWLASDECFGEFKAAWYMGKRIIPLVALAPGNAVAGERLAKVLAEDQGFDVTACMDAYGRLDLACDAEIERRLAAGLRAAGALAKIGLDPEAFAIDRKLRPMPFPGLAAFGDEDADAALFYGRRREIAETLEELRKVRAECDMRPFVILGASGAGKSSLLRAGIIPRLRREAPAWLALRAFRPGADPLLNFEPAIRYNVTVDTSLVDALMEDAPKDDAFPLLAFALQRLWRQYAASGALTRANYDKVGGLRGLIEDAAERALRGLSPDEDVALFSGPPIKHRIDLGASTFVPALAQINDQGAAIRRVAAWNSFNEE
jgi:hypothetical protein